MKKTIAGLALLASTTSHGIVGPLHAQPQDGAPVAAPRPAVTCIEIGASTIQEGAYTLGSCDETRANQFLRRAIGPNGCAVGQLALKLDVTVESCPTPVQL